MKKPPCRHLWVLDKVIPAVVRRDRDDILIRTCRKCGETRQEFRA